MDELIRSIWERVASIHLSVSHDHHHINVVMDYALQLQDMYGGDREVVAIASILHDLGRSDDDRAHGSESREASIELSQKVLSDLPLSDKKKAKVFEAIREHDQPDVSPSTTEGRILKDADFLAGFGAWGILRIAMWSGESGRNVSEVKEKLDSGMLRRVKNVEFDVTKRIAFKKMPNVWSFLERLEQTEDLSTENYTGKYIWFEGISGSGKDTQADLLLEHIDEEHDELATKVQEPGAVYESCMQSIENSDGAISTDVRKWILLADRQQQIDSTVKPTLQDGNHIISVRSFLSTIVYQGGNAKESQQIDSYHEFVPKPDLVFLFDLDPETAMERIEDRGEDRGRYEKKEKLQRHRASFKSLVEKKFGDEAVIIDATQSIREIQEIVRDETKSLIDNK
jgi:dTMP kinase